MSTLKAAGDADNSYTVFPLGQLSRTGVVFLRVANLLSLLGVFTINALATTLPLNGNSTGSISDDNPTYITPAGYAFSIWGLIYVFLGLFAIYQMFPSTYASRPVNEAYGVVLLLNALLNISWIISWHWLQLVVACAIIWAMWLTLLVIKLRLTPFLPATWLEYFFVQVPISLYIGWITCAAILNLLIVVPVLAASQAAGLAGLGVATAIGTFVVAYHRDGVTGAVVVWALVAIGIEQKDNSVIWWTAIGCAAFLGALSLAMWIWNVVGLIRRTRTPWSVAHQGQFRVGEVVAVAV